VLWTCGGCAFGGTQAAHNSEQRCLHTIIISA